MAILRATSPSQTLTGTSGIDYLTDVPGGDTLIGLGGDDTYYIYDSSTSVVEQAGGGNDTVYAYVPFVAPDNIEALNVATQWITGIANSAGTNLIAARDAVTLVSGSGNDTMSNAGVSFTTYEFQVGSGHDVISGFKAGSASGHDSIRLDDFGFTSFAQVAPLLSQVGSDVLLQLDAKDSVLIKDTALTSLTADDFQLQLDTSGLALTFDESFDSLSLWDAATNTGRWKTNYGWGTQSGSDAWSSRTITNNNELELYVDPAFSGSSSTPLGLDPFTISNGVLDIAATPTPSSLSSSLWNYPYLSGQLNTQKSFSQLYGYFEMRAELPAVTGTWPAFWMLPTGGTSELDVVEAFGSHNVFGTAHSVTYSAIDPTNSHSDWVPTSDTTFHTYGVLWTADTLTWYVDRVAIGSTATPSDMHDPMYMLINLAIGGVSGTPAAGFAGADMKVDYVRAYALAGSPDTTPPSLTIAAGTGLLSGNAPSTTVTFTFSEAVSGFSAADVAGVGGTLANLAATADPRVWTATFTATAGYSGTGSLSVAAGLYTDLAGNPGGAANASFGVDTTADADRNLALAIPLTAINAAQRTAVAFSVSGLDADLTSATVTFTDPAAHSVTVQASAGVVNLGTFVSGPVTSVLTVADHVGNTKTVSGATIALDAIDGSSGNDTITGSVGDDVFNGLAGRDVLYGLDGNDILDGGLGNDRLIGGSGNDIFLFDTAITGAKNVDTISDFGVGNDIVELDHNIFTGLALGVLSAASFALNRATGTAPQIMYDQVHGDLYYDSNGKGAGGSTQFATLAGAPTLDAGHIVVV